MTETDGTQKTSVAPLAQAATTAQDRVVLGIELGWVPIVRTVTSLLFSCKLVRTVTSLLRWVGKLLPPHGWL